MDNSQENIENIRKDAKNSKNSKNAIIKSEANFSLVKIIEEKKFIANLVDLNARATTFGLVINEKTAKEIAVYRNNALINNDRFEIKSDAITRLTSAFLKTRYISQEDLSETIGEIIDIFYHIKNETENAISDDDLISEMIDVFTYTCFGSIEQMQSKGLEKILRKYKFNDTEIWDNIIGSGDGGVRDSSREALVDNDEDWRE